MEFVTLALVSILIREGVEGYQDLKIQRGYDSDIHRFPFVGSYRVEKDGKQLMVCTVNLINLYTAMTAGHCLIENILSEPFRFFSIDKYKPYAIFGVTNRKDVNNPFYQKRHVSMFLIHPKARYITLYPFESRFDIGSVRWTTPLRLSPSVQLAPFPRVDDLHLEENFGTIMDEISSNTDGRCEVAGWGALNVSRPGAIFPDVLQAAKFNVLTTEVCCARYFNYSEAECLERLGVVEKNPQSIGHHCYERLNLGTSAANGDSGSPLICSLHGNCTVVGITINGFWKSDNISSGVIGVMKPGLFVDIRIAYKLRLNYEMSSNANKISTGIYTLLMIAAGF